MLDQWPTLRWVWDEFHHVRQSVTEAIDMDGNQRTRLQYQQGIAISKEKIVREK